jgi:hypothetical protein
MCDYHIYGCGAARCQQGRLRSLATSRFGVAMQKALRSLATSLLTGRFTHHWRARLDASFLWTKPAAGTNRPCLLRRSRRVRCAQSCSPAITSVGMRRLATVILRPTQCWLEANSITRSYRFRIAGPALLLMSTRRILTGPEPLVIQDARTSTPGPSVMHQNMPQLLQVLHCIVR